MISGFRAQTSHPRRSPPGQFSMRRFSIPRGLLLVCGLASILFAPPVRCQAGDTTGEQPYKPHVAPASADAEKAAKAIKAPRDVNASVFAAEPMMANPVAFGFDERGRVYVVETFRLHHGVTDTRNR